MNIVKSIVIIIFLCFLAFAGISHLLQWNLAYLTFPWGAWQMFNTHPPFTIQPFLIGFTSTGNQVILDITNYFDMPGIFIDRGTSHTIITTIATMNYTDQRRVGKELCTYTLQKHNAAIDSDATPKLADMVVGYVSYRIDSTPYAHKKTLNRLDIISACSTSQTEL